MFLLGIAACLTLVVVVILSVTGTQRRESRTPAPVTPRSEDKADRQTLIGNWQRPDGGYTLAVRSIRSDGSADVGYFNPRAIHVSRAKVTQEGQVLKLFVELQDKGYPGSTYTLLYHAERDMLAGIYYQAALGQSFEVIFVRTN